MKSAGSDFQQVAAADEVLLAEREEVAAAGALGGGSEGRGTTSRWPGLTRKASQRAGPDEALLEGDPLRIAGLDDTSGPELPLVVL